MRVTVLNRQTLLDIALQECGTFESALKVAERNGLNITDDLQPGQTLEILPEDIEKKGIVNTLAAGGIKPATAISEGDIKAAPYKGIGYMAIERDFIVR